MLSQEKQDQRDLMILKISNKTKTFQEELRKYQMILQRLNIITGEVPKDQFGEDMSEVEIEKHFNKGKAEFEKIFPRDESAK